MYFNSGRITAFIIFIIKKLFYRGRWQRRRITEGNTVIKKGTMFLGPARSLKISFGISHKSSFIVGIIFLFIKFKSIEMLERLSGFSLSIWIFEFGYDSAIIYILSKVLTFFISLNCFGISIEYLKTQIYFVLIT